MQTQNESSSLVALRELRESDKRRRREAEQAKATAEQARLAAAAARAREERLAREEADRKAALAESTRLGRELAAARAEAASLRSELERVNRAPVLIAAPPASRARTAAWLGLSAGATMLVGALALAAAMQPSPPPAPLAERTPQPVLACPDRAPVPPLATVSHPAPPSASIAPVPGKRRPPLPTHQQGKPTAKVVCDGTDPLCGIDPKLSDDLGKQRRKR
jgi:colicin import membrane protein